MVLSQRLPKSFPYQWIKPGEEQNRHWRRARFRTHSFLFFKAWLISYATQRIKLCFYNTRNIKLKIWLHFKVIEYIHTCHHDLPNNWLQTAGITSEKMSLWDKHLRSNIPSIGLNRSNEWFGAWMLEYLWLKWVTNM